MTFDYKGKQIEINTLEEWVNFLNSLQPSEKFVDSLLDKLPEDFVEVYVNEYLNLEI